MVFSHFDLGEPHVYFISFTQLFHFNVFFFTPIFTNFCGPQKLCKRNCQLIGNSY